MGLIETYKAKTEGCCATCDHLVLMNEGCLLACEVHDKYILPDFPHGHESDKCKDWERRKENNHAED